MLFLSDLDFTLLRSDTTLGNFTKKIWNRASRDHKLSIATARSFTGVQELLKGLLLKNPLILLDGAIIANPDGGVIDMAEISKSLGDAIINLTRAEFNIEPLIVALETDREAFYYPKILNNYQQELIKTMEMRNRVFTQGKFCAKEHNLKIVYQANKEISFQLEQSLKSTFKNSIEIKRSKDLYFDCYFVTILNPYGDKAHALKKLEEITNIPIDNTTVFGDSHNDIGMFELAGTKVAVANAIDELKQRADIVLKETNDQEGVAKYLQQTLKI